MINFQKALDSLNDKDNTKTAESFISSPILGFIYRYPNGLSIEEWEKWEGVISKKYPIQFLVRTFPSLLWQIISNKFLGWKYYLTCKYFKPFNVIKLRKLPPTYTLPDIIMEEFIEQMIMDNIVNNKLLTTINFNFDENHKKFGVLLNKINDFYTTEKPKILKDMGVLRDELLQHNKNDMFKILDLDARTSNIIDDLVKLENQLYKKISEIMILIVSNRSLLWK